MTTKHETITTNKTATLFESEVTLFDCNCHLLEDVIALLIKAIKCTRTTAIRYADTAQQFGQAVVYKGMKDDCERVASILSSTGLKVSVTK